MAASPQIMPSSDVWDPRNVLGVDPDSRKFTCVGTTKRGLRCRISMIAGSDLSEASDILDDLASESSVSRRTRRKLEELAFLTLCPRWHRKPGYSQVEEMASEWASAMEEHLSQLQAESVRSRRRARQSVTESTTTTTTTTTRTSPSTTSTSRRRLPSPDSPSLPTPPDTPPATRSRRQEREASPQTAMVVARPATPAPAATPVERTSDIPTTSDSPATPIDEPTPLTSNSEPLPTTTPSGIIPTPPTPVLTPSPSPTRRRNPLTDDCPICQEPCSLPTPSPPSPSSSSPTPSSSHAVYCRAQCGTNIHRTCFKTWRTHCLREFKRQEDSGYFVHLSDERILEKRDGCVTCVMCRSVWLWEWED